MMNIRLNTSAEIMGTLQELPAASVVRIPLQTKHKPIVKKKQAVIYGQVIAENPTKSAFSTGFVHATIDGVIDEITSKYIAISATTEAPSGDPIDPCSDLDNLQGEELCRKLLELGIDTDKFHPTRTLIINGLNPEPGVLVSEGLLKEAHKTLERGVQVLERAIKPGTIKLVVAAGKNITLHGCTTVQASDAYPRTRDALVLYAATGAERPDNVDIISVSDLYRVGRVGETKLPLTDVIISVASKLYRVPTGISVREVLAAADVPYDAEKSKVILGGPMCGTALFDLDAGIPESSTAITIVAKNQFPEVGPHPCINCGECVLACPARIHPGMLSRYAEFGMFDTARTRHIDACFECGMCTFVCPANRPVLQYILRAKQHLQEQDEFVATCRLQD